ncbi:MAG: integrase [Rhodocyclales bacterium]|nr:integrase [Rhodocyclales bacterium]
MLRRKRGDSTLYYYQHADGRHEALGSDFRKAQIRWSAIQAELASHSADGFTAVAEAYEKRGIAALSPKTQSEYCAALVRLKAVFRNAPMHTVLPGDVGKMMDKLIDTPFLANRIKATLSRMWNWARGKGLTSAPNPCVGVESYHEPRRQVLVTPQMFWDMHDAGDQVLKDWLRLDMLIGQRVTDILKLRRDQITIKEDRQVLGMRAKKNRALGQFNVTGDLAALLDELLMRPRKATGPWLVQTDDGQRVTYTMLKNRFDAARDVLRERAEKAGEEWVHWQRRDLRKASLNLAKTLEEARRRGLHLDSRTTARHYELAIEAEAASMPKRVSNSDTDPHQT